MTKSDDYRLYLEECFRGMHAEMRAEFKNVHDSLDIIKEQTIKTNNRVSHLEDKVDCLEVQAVKHPVECINGAKIEEIQNDLLEYKFFKRYPKIFIGVIVIMALSMFIGFGVIKTGQSNLKKEVDMINTPIKTSRGIELLPSGVIIDSIGNIKDN